VPKQLQSLAPHDCELIRIGARGDGGYVVGRASVHRSKALVSLGIASEWSFDEDFLRARPDLHYVGCDRGTGFLAFTFACFRSLLTSTRWASGFRQCRTAIRFLRLVNPLHRRRKFFRRWAKSRVQDSRRDITLQQLLASSKHVEGVFLKMDIEGGEYELLPQIVEMIAVSPQTFAGLCIEFHDLSNRQNEIVEFVQAIRESMAVVHLHANNCVPLTGEFPEVVEISFSPKSDVLPQQVDALPRPLLDFPNDSDQPDFRLVFALGQTDQSS